MRILLLILLTFNGFMSYSQSAIKPLKHNWLSCKGDDCTDKFIHALQVSERKNPNQKLELQAWSVRMFDSIGESQLADSILTLIPLEKRSQLKFGYALYLFEGKKFADSTLFNEAISAYYKGLKLVEQKKLKIEEATLQRLIGLSFLKLNENKKAETHLLRSLNISESIDYELGIANATISLGNAVKDQGRYKEAIKYYERSLQLAQKIENKKLIAGNYNNLGNVMRRTKKYQKAIEYFNKALEMNRKAGNQEWISFNYNNLGQTYVDLKNYPKAIQFFRSSCELKQEIGDSLNLISSYLGLAEAFAKNGNYQEAYTYMVKHNTLKDTMNLREQARALDILETRYETERKEAEIKNLLIKGELEQERIDRLNEKAVKNRNYIVLSLFIAMVLALGVIILIRSNRQKIKSNALLNDKNKQIEESHAALSLAMEELQIKNNEIIDSINYANYIQQAALPNLKSLHAPDLNFELFFAPKDIVSGDFYYFFPSQNTYYFGIGDCTGHGVPGAMVSLVGMNALEKVIKEESHTFDTSKVERVNELVVKSLHRGSEHINDGMDLSFCHFNPETKLLQFTGANHNALVIRKKKLDDSGLVPKYENDQVHIHVLNGTRRPIGKTFVKQPFDTHDFSCKSGDRIVLFSDGYADQTGGEIRKKLKRVNMMNLLLASSTNPIDEQLRYMRDAFVKWKLDVEQVDDVCLMLVEIK